MRITEIRRAEHIAHHYGVVSQLFKAQEEMGELNREIICFLTDKVYNIEEEIADVYIMILQLMVLFNTEKVEAIVEQKLDRQLDRIMQEIEEKERAENEKQNNDEGIAIPELTDEEMEHLDKVFRKSAGVSDEANKEE